MHSQRVPSPRVDSLINNLSVPLRIDAPKPGLRTESALQLALCAALLMRRGMAEYGTNVWKSEQRYRN